MAIMFWKHEATSFQKTPKVEREKSHEAIIRAKHSPRKRYKKRGKDPPTMVPEVHQESKMDNEGTQIAQFPTWIRIKNTGELLTVLGLIGIATGVVVAILMWAVTYYCRKRMRRTQELRNIELQAQERHEQCVRVDPTSTRVTGSPRAGLEEAEHSL
jgi:hypothetical protein